MKKKLIILCVTELIFIMALTAMLVTGIVKRRRSSDIEINVRTAENLQSASDVTELVDMAAGHNIGVINLCVKQDEDDEFPSGEVFYDSSIAPAAEGYEDFDVLEAVIDAAHKKGIKVRAWIPQFHDAAAAAEHPSWRMMTVSDGKSVPYSSDGEIFISPLNSDAQKYEESIIKEVAENYDVDGIALDWLRFDDYDMDLSDAVRSDYKSEMGYDPADIDFDGDDDRLDEWNEWREKKLGGYVASVRKMLDDVKPDIELGANILAPEFKECGQNMAYMNASLDFVSPMAYYTDWGFDTDWVSSADSGIIHDTVKLSGDAEVIPALNLPEDAGEISDNKDMLAELKQNYPHIKSFDYFIYGKWNDEQLERAEESLSD